MSHHYERPALYVEEGIPLVYLSVNQTPNPRSACAIATEMETRDAHLPLPKIVPSKQVKKQTKIRPEDPHLLSAKSFSGAS